MCPAVSFSVANYAPSLTPALIAALPPTVPGVRARIVVGEPSQLKIMARLRWSRNGRSHTTDLGERSLDVPGTGNLRLALPSSLADELPRGTPVRLKLRIAAVPDSSPGCEPSVAHVSLRTQVIRVLASFQDRLQT